jgi:D-alanine-D-alanine ligase
MGRKIRVGVLFGGQSGEHEISLLSARSIMQAIDREKYEVVALGITKEGRWITRGNPMRQLVQASNLWRKEQLLDANAAADGAPDAAGETPSETPAEHGGEPVAALVAAGPDAAGPGALAAGSPLAELDVIFPVLHGPHGEDGTVQGMLELAGVPYVGAGVLGSALGMDKAAFKSLMEAHGLPIVPWRLVLRARWERAGEREGVLAELEAGLRYPLFVKPANLGSSVGISKAHDRAELAAGLDDAARYDRRLIVEQGVDHAREIEISVLGNDEPIASVPGEIVPGREFYDYAAKYIEDSSELLVPARLPEATVRQAQELALAAFRAIDGAGMARVDFLLDARDDALYLNELNTIPGFTAISMYPKLWAASGIPYPELLDRLIALALERDLDRRRNRMSYEPTGSDHT